MNVIALTIIASWLTMTISLAVANFPALVERKISYGFARSYAIEESKIDVVILLVFPIFWIPFLLYPSANRLVNSMIERSIPSDPW